MPNYTEIAQYLRNGECWSHLFQGQKCKRPGVAQGALKSIQEMLDNPDRKTTGGNVLCGPCSWSGASQNVIIPATPRGEQAAIVISSQVKHDARRRRNL